VTQGGSGGATDSPGSGLMWVAGVGVRVLGCWGRGGGSEVRRCSRAVAQRSGGGNASTVGRQRGRAAKDGWGGDGGGEMSSTQRWR
jgi:hypothetical protein